MQRMYRLFPELLDGVDTKRQGSQAGDDDVYPNLAAIRHDPKLIKHTRLQPQRSPGAPRSDAPWDKPALEYVREAGYVLDVVFRAYIHSHHLVVIQEAVGKRQLCKVDIINGVT